MTTIDYIPNFDLEYIAFKRYYYFFIVQNTDSVKTNKDQILSWLEEKYANGIDYQKEFGSKVSFTYILFDQKASAFICHDINEFKKAFDCSTKTELSAGMETLSTFLKKHMDEHPAEIYDEYNRKMHDVFFIGDGNDYMEDKTEILKSIKEFSFCSNDHCIAFYTPDMQYMGNGDKDDETTRLFFQIKQPVIDWKGLMESNLKFISWEEDRKILEKARKELPHKTHEQLLEEMKELLSQQEQKGLIRFEVKDDHVFVHGYADLENRQGYPVGDGIVFFSGKGNHELYIANTLTSKIRQISTAGGLLLVDNDEIDYETIEKRCKHGKNNARCKYIKYAGINRWDGFKNGICAISWMLFPEGIYFADSDGFGGEDSNEEKVYGIMDTSLRFIEPFRPINDIRMYLAKLRNN